VRHRQAQYLALGVSSGKQFFERILPSSARVRGARSYDSDEPENFEKTSSDIEVMVSHIIGDLAYMQLVVQVGSALCGFTELVDLGLGRKGLSLFVLPQDVVERLVPEPTSRPGRPSCPSRPGRNRSCRVVTVSATAQHKTERDNGNRNSYGPMMVDSAHGSSLDWAGL
jgi:hypothetical protein